jgi:HSP20 family protein
MALIRWEPARELNTLQSEMNRLFNAFFEGGDRDATARRWAPAMDLIEADNHLILRADLPGLSEKDVKIEVQDNVLTVSGERKAEQEDKTDGYYRIERAFGSFSRSLTLPQGIDADAISADFTDGVLEVRIPKPEQRKPHRVAIGASSVSGTATEK